MYIIPGESAGEVSAASIPRAASSTPVRAPPVASPPPHAFSPRPSPEEPSQAPVPTGYLGYTSYFSFYEETENILTGSKPNAASTSTPGPDSARSGAPPAPTKLSSKILNTCLEILNSLPEPSVGLERFRHTPKPFSPFPQIIAQRILESFYETLGCYLGSDRNSLHLEFVARRLCANTARPFAETEPDGERWTAQLLGDNLRWESVGVVLTLKARRRESLDALRRCVELCSELSHGNSVLVYLWGAYTMVESCVSGDASKWSLPDPCFSKTFGLKSRGCVRVSKLISGFETWRGHSDTVAMLTFLGLHAETNPPNYEPTLASEFRRGIYAWIYYMGMNLVTFTGRPPVLSSAYSSTPLPLDLSFEDLISDRDTRMEAVSRLGADSWDVRMSEVTPLGLKRGRAALALIKEEVLRFALGQGQSYSHNALLYDLWFHPILLRSLSNQQLCLPAKLSGLKQRALDTFSALPSVLHYRPGDVDDLDLDTQILYPRIAIRLGHLQNVLFIERLLLRQGKEDRADLLSASFEMVSLTLTFWTHMERRTASQDDNEWLVNLDQAHLPSLASNQTKGYGIRRPLRRYSLPRAPQTKSARQPAGKPRDNKIYHHTEAQPARRLLGLDQAACAEQGLVF